MRVPDDMKSENDRSIYFFYLKDEKEHLFIMREALKET